MSMQAPPSFPCSLETPVTVLLPASSKWLCCLLRSSVCTPVACFPTGKRERPLGRSIQCRRVIGCLLFTSRGLRELKGGSRGWNAPFAILHASWCAILLAHTENLGTFWATRVNMVLLGDDLFRLSELVLRGTAGKWVPFQNVKGLTQLKTVLHYAIGVNLRAWELHKNAQETCMFVPKQWTVCQTLAEIQCPWSFWQYVVCSGLVGQSQLTLQEHKFTSRFAELKFGGVFSTCCVDCLSIESYLLKEACYCFLFSFVFDVTDSRNIGGKVQVKHKRVALNVRRS